MKTKVVHREIYQWPEDGGPYYSTCSTNNALRKKNRAFSFFIPFGKLKNAVWL